jgi:hypothetical protein
MVFNLVPKSSEDVQKRTLALVPHGVKPLHSNFVVSTKPTTIAAIIVAAISGSSVHEKSPPTLHSLGDFLLGN